ncbi:hypothetical protein [uncultured Cohaesibacter sp.]|uniref:hypothetical protein n=1 Tax=uncultured Cohaesibacter sp. TaxID=1002546 RepID=UPI0029C86702|nr:hypothetical protein [uncultured Cohaesibacter sp.]
MADYYAILKRAVEAVPTQNREQRQTIYDKARKALLTKLQNMDPPLPPADISKQRMALEEAVRAVERDLSAAASAASAQASSHEEEKEMGDGRMSERSASTSAPAAPRARAGEEARADHGYAQVDAAPKGASAPQPYKPTAMDKPRQEILEEKSPSDKVVRRAGQDVLKNAVRDANALGEATNKAVRHAQDAADAVGEERDGGEAARIEPTLGDAVVSQSKTYKRNSIEDGVSERPGYSNDEDGDDQGSKSRFGLIAIVMVLIVVLAGSGYLLYSNMEAFLGSDTASVQETGSDGSAQVEKTQSGDAASGSGQFDMAAKSVKTITVTPPSEDDGARSDDSALPQGDVTAPVADTVPLQGLTANVGANDAGISVAQRAILYEEPGGESEPGSANGGEVIWAVEGDGDGAVVTIEASIPDKNMSFNITMKKNQDAELPASHLIEISATHGDNDADKAIVKIPGLILKPTEQSRGEGLVGAAIRIADDLHWVALTSGDREERYNLELLHLRGWIDIPIQYKTGRRAILTLEKGEAGDRVITQAIQAWTGQ